MIDQETLIKSCLQLFVRMISDTDSFTCDFDAEDLCGWTQDKTDDYEWVKTFVSIELFLLFLCQSGSSHLPVSIMYYQRMNQEVVFFIAGESNSGYH